MKEGLEPPLFWSSLGGKRKYASQREARDVPKDPRLYACSLSQGEVLSYQADCDLSFLGFLIKSSLVSLFEAVSTFCVVVSFNNASSRRQCLL